jgi:DnaK suppressor protein
MQDANSMNRTRHLINAGSSLGMSDMNATVTKSAKKTAARKNPGKPMTKPDALVKPKRAGKTVGGSTLKRVVGNLVRKLADASKSAVKPARTTKKIAASSPGTAAKAGVKKTAPSALKPAAKPRSTVSVKSASSSVTSGKAPTVKKPAAIKGHIPVSAKTGTAGKYAAKPAGQELNKTAAPAMRKPDIADADTRQSGLSMSSNKTVARIADKIEKTVISNAREVVTKTMKSTQTIATDGPLLTETQILKMSEKDYMNPAQLAFFKARLQQLEKDLLKNAGETTEHLRETVLVPDPADRATIEEEHALELRTRDRERKLLKKVQQSIASIDSGDYGWCEETGEPIGIPRLLARPTATLSLEAQQRRELKQKLYGD